VLGCFDQYRQATGAGLIRIWQRFEREHREHISDHSRLDNRRREFWRFSLDCDNSSEWHAKLLMRRIAIVKPPLVGGFSFVHTSSFPLHRADRILDENQLRLAKEN
jgi:hypothetical protein